MYYPKVEKTTLPVIVMEKMHGSLRGLAEKCADIPVNVTLSILNDVCCGLQYLHGREPPIVHRNLTPNNILLCYHFKAKISDIGIVNRTDTQALSQPPKMDAFLPSEALANKSANDVSIDIFSFGGIILYMSTHQWPQSARVRYDPDTGKRSVMVTELQRHQQSLDEMTDSYTNLKPLVISCLDESPQGRPSVAQTIMEIKKIRIAHNQKFHSMIWGTDDLTLQSHTEQEPLHKQQQEQHTYRELEMYEPEVNQQEQEEEEIEESHQQPEMQEQQPVQWKVEKEMKIPQQQKQSPQVS